MIRILVGASMAEITNYVWTSPDKALLSKLNGLLPEFGPSGADPNPDLTAAQDAVSSLNGNIMDIQQGDEVKFVPGRLY